MSTRVRALLWEECRTGGVIALWCLFCGLLLIFMVFLDCVLRTLRWTDACETAVFVAVSASLFPALLLTLTAANSGHLTGGFSERTLRLPVTTFTAVSVALLTRLVMVFIVACGLSVLCLALFEQGPTVHTVLLVATFYLVIQTLDWLRGPAPWISLACIGLGSISVFAYTLAGRRATWTGLIETGHGSSLLIFVATLLPAYAVSLWAVRATRCGERLTPALPTSIEGMSFVSWSVPQRPFSSPLSARVWFDLRRTGIYVPVLFFIVWLGLSLSIWMAEYIDHASSEEAISTFVRPLVFEVMPYFAAFFAISAYAGLSGKVSSKSRVSLFPYLQPVTAAEMAQARLLAAAVCMGLLFLFVIVISNASFLLQSDAFAMDVLRGSLAHGETNIKELLAYFLGLPIFVGLTCWICLSAGTRTGGILGGCLAARLLLELLAHTAEEKWLHLFAPIATWLLILLVIAVAVGAAFAAWNRGLVSGRSLAMGAALWAALALFLYPLSSLMQPGPVFSIGASVACLAISALAILPYFAIVLDLNRRRHGADVVGNPAQHRRADRGEAGGPLPAAALCQKSGDHRPASLRRVLRWGALVGAVIFLAWIRWPSEPAYKTALRSQGLPTNLAELDAWYPHVDDGQNLASLYLITGQEVQQSTQNWIRAAVSAEEVSVEENQEPRTEREVALEHLLALGDARIGRTELVPADVWRRTMDYWDRVGRPAAVELHETARSGLKASRYPIDLRQGYDAELPHLARLRSLARVLALEAFVGSVRKQPGVVVDAVLDILPIADSLDAEPIVISQLVRMAVLETAVGALEDAMNRVSFRAEDLERLQSGLASALPPAKERRCMMDRAMIGELLVSLEWRFLRVLDDSSTGTSMWSEELPRLQLPVMDLIDFLGFERYASVRIIQTWIQEAHQYTETGILKTTPAEKVLFDDALFWRTLLASLTLPPLARTYEAEWRVRTRLDLARTALAVERFRLAHLRLPDQLAALVPDFLDRIPRDPWNDGRPISYRIKDNGEFVVYSFALNRRDDLGELPPSAKNWWTEGDLTFTVAPPEIRDRPQIASVSGS